MHFPLREIAKYVRTAPTEELLDRVTVYREGMEPAALDLMEGELDRRGVTRTQIADHDAKQRATAIMLPDGTARRCCRCNRPAVREARGWHRMKVSIPLVGRLIGRGSDPLGFSVPVFPRLHAYCEVHNPLAVKENVNNRDGS
ncbi:MAG: hypothetical protein ACKODX_18250 [Gemmata sp.]